MLHLQCCAGHAWLIMRRCHFSRMCCGKHMCSVSTATGSAYLVESHPQFRERVTADLMSQPGGPADAQRWQTSPRYTKQSLADDGRRFASCHSYVVVHTVMLTDACEYAKQVFAGSMHSCRISQALSTSNLVTICGRVCTVRSQVAQKRVT
eukprot:jgi/Ulvmu1/213/UM001_0217.1